MIYHNISRYFVIKTKKNIIFVAKTRNYDLFVSKVYDYTLIDSFWGSAGVHQYLHKLCLTALKFKTKYILLYLFSKETFFLTFTSANSVMNMSSEKQHKFSIEIGAEKATFSFTVWIWAQHSLWVLSGKRSTHVKDVKLQSQHWRNVTFLLSKNV